MPTTIAICRPTGTAPKNNGAEQYDLFLIYDKDQTSDPASFTFTWELRYLLEHWTKPPLIQGPAKYLAPGQYELQGLKSKTNSSYRLYATFPIKIGASGIKAVAGTEECYYKVVSDFETNVSQGAVPRVGNAAFRLTA